MDLDSLRHALAETTSLRAEGRVTAVTGLSIRLRLAGARVGELVKIGRKGEQLLAEIVGFQEGEVIAMPLGVVTGIGPDDVVEGNGEGLRVPVGPGLLGRVVDGFGRPIDGRPLGGDTSWVEAARRPPNALERRPIERALVTGVRVVDGLLTLGVGQRVGLFAGSGVGKSTLLGCFARGLPPGVIVVVALVGERGREVKEFIDECLGAALERSVVVVATSDAPALERMKAAETATAIAEGFRDRGHDVLLLVDSVTRYARALREVGLASGEPPARRGYPPTVFAALPRLLERGGQGRVGSITGLYTVLVEGSDLEEPIADEVRGILDGHIVLSRAVAERGTYPAVDVPASLSRVMRRTIDDEHHRVASHCRRLIAAYESRRDLIAMGAYERGGDPLVDKALSISSELKRFLEQAPGEHTPFEQTKRELSSIWARTK